MRRITELEIQKQNEYISLVKARLAGLLRVPRAFVETYGCQQNESDSERLKGMIADMGFEFADEPKSADLVLYNTCAVRENAERKVYGNIGALKHAHQMNSNMVIAVCGCMMQQKHIADTFCKRYKHVDIVFGPNSLYKFPQYMWEAVNHGKIVDVNQNEEDNIAEGIDIRRDALPTAKIPIMYGCNNFCTYCIVPYVRGRERSRTSEDIIKEVRTAAEQGYKEVMLLGQNVNSYSGEDGVNFPELLRCVCRVDGIERVRFVTSHPKDLSDELIDVMAEEDKICKALHLPVQSGSDRILKAMNRKYTRAEYLEKVCKIRAKMPDIVLTTDIIVGFPNETDEDFNDTLSLVEEVRYDNAYTFIYSKRHGTPAAEIDDEVDDKHKHENFNKLLDLQATISREKNDKYLGTIQEVLVEGVSKTNEETLTGRNEGGKVVNFTIPDGIEKETLIGNFADIKITLVRPWSLFGELG